MPELPSPARPAWGPSYCTSPCCAERRAKLECPEDCICKECQPGPGIDFDGRVGVRTATRRAELRLLLKKNDQGRLTLAEEARLDELCHQYVFGN